MHLRKINAQMEYYLKIDPDKLTDEQWAMKYQNLVWVRIEEAKRNPFAT